ncbi:MAG: response regulator transcription factor [Chloroflexi bacterium]|jgi:two-component system, OmpR family, alkaline phosphatase synthesis response regulator PhoP|nr:response regulator transcription factor [Chloroflexota bacterium]MBT7082151.1 response regulator transcription factor [Chloroflexota bacterium]MBT7290792.1 response regulator transcription factor [Chloroflexota bacterium]
MAQHKVLVVDDDKKTVELVKAYLERDGYKVLTAYDGKEALSIARESRPDLIVLDLMLPGMDGLEVCSTLREESDVAIIMLTARTTHDDRTSGLDIGADDYVTKPFSPKELASRVRAVLRRLPGERGPDEITNGNLIISFRNHQVYLDDKSLDLTPVEFKILGILAKEPGRVFSRPQLITDAFGYDFDGFDRTIDVHILNLRKKIEADPGKPKYIKTVYGAGYKLEVSHVK